MLTNPKFIIKTAYLLFLGFGAFHLTRLGVALFSGIFLARFGKPNLVRETSKLHTTNIFTLPMLIGKKIIHRTKRRTEKDLLDGVILEKNLED